MRNLNKWILLLFLSFEGVCISGMMVRMHYFETTNRQQNMEVCVILDTVLSISSL